MADSSSPVHVGSAVGGVSLHVTKIKRRSIGSGCVYAARHAPTVQGGPDVSKCCVG
jgi:hypothetical protein